MRAFYTIAEVSSSVGNRHVSFFNTFLIKKKRVKQIYVKTNMTNQKCIEAL
jgi:hypothetical protein